MKTFRVALLVTALIGVAQTAQAQTALPADRSKAPLVKITDKALPFTVSLPKGWVGLDLKDGVAGVTIASQAQPPAALMRLLFIPKNGQAVNLQSEFTKFEGAIKEGGAKVTFKGEKAANYGGVSGLIRLYTITNSPGTAKANDLTMRVWFGNGAKNFYSFQLTVDSASFARMDTLFDKVLASVAF